MAPNLDVEFGGGVLAGLLEQYEAARRWSHSLIADLDDEQLQWRPDEQASAIAWHLGHQAAVNHHLVRNLVAAEPSFAPELDVVFDSATPEPARRDLPGRDRILAYRDQVAASTRATIDRVATGQVGAPDQLAVVAEALLRVVINHEYQHDAWVLEVRSSLTDRPAPMPTSTELIEVDGYWMIGC
jgi:hypothetical protein